MMTKARRTYYMLGAAMTAGMIMSGSGKAFAQGGVDYNGNFNEIAQNITSSIGGLPGLLSALAYLFGLVLGVLGIMKIKDHVENPSQTKLKDGAIRLAAGGALFALPIIFEAMQNTIGDSNEQVTGAVLNRAKMNVQ